MRRVSATRISNLLNQPLPSLPSLPDGISTWTGDELDNLRRQAAASSSAGAGGAGSSGRPETELESFQKNLFLTIDILGVRSQRAQSINDPLTSVSRLHESPTYRLFLLTHDHRGMGILKVGVKRLFLTHPQTRQLVECEPFCVLDFFVDEGCQRKGFGKQLFEHMLSAESARLATPAHIAIDRPSAKFIGFLRKHYGLVDTVPQVNNFVVFTAFFAGTTVTERGKLLRNGASTAKKDSPGAALHGGARAPGVPSRTDNASRSDAGAAVWSGAGLQPSAAAPPSQLPFLGITPPLPRRSAAAVLSSAPFAAPPPPPPRRPDLLPPAAHRNGNAANRQTRLSAAGRPTPPPMGALFDPPAAALPGQRPAAAAGPTTVVPLSPVKERAQPPPQRYSSRSRERYDIITGQPL